MLIGMKPNTKKVTFLLSLFLTLSVQAELYKGLNSEGNVVYSDTPFTNSEAFTAPIISTTKATKITKKKAKDAATKEETKPFKYTDFNITSPTQNQTLWNQPDVSVSLALKPKLNTENNHTFWLMLDSKPIVKNSLSTSMQIGRLDRGAHQLQAQVRDESGKIVVRSRAVVIHIQNTFVKKAPL